MVRSEVVCDEIADVQTKEPLFGRSSGKKIQRLAGIHKAAVPIGETLQDNFETVVEGVGRILNYFSDKQNFCVSLHCSQADKREYDFVVSSLLQIIREKGFRKANLLRPHSGYELYAQEVLDRNAIEFTIFPAATNAGYEVGATFYIPGTEEFQIRATKRPVVSSQVALAPRLARLLVHLANVPVGGLLLDPFCGSGTILGEAMLEGIKCIGVDRDPNSIRNTERNLAWIASTSNATTTTRSDRLGSFETILGDATALSRVLRNGPAVDAIVTEPILLPNLTSTPGLKAARSMIKNASVTYSDFLYSARDVLRESGRLVVVVPSIRTSEGKDVAVMLEEVESAGFREFQPLRDSTITYPVKVNTGSTRWIKRMVYVYERV
jgi:tRNA G10  N-methylase Trm11